MEVKKILRPKTLIVVVAVVLIIFASYFVGKFSLGLIGGSKYQKPSLMSEANRKSIISIIKESDPSIIVQDKGAIYNVSSKPGNSSFGLKIIKNANLNMYVNKGKFLETYNRISSMVETYRGSVINSNYSKENDTFSGFIEVIVPKEKFDSVINKLGELGSVTNLEISSSDVTQEYVDLIQDSKSLKHKKNFSHPG
jgi:predicted AAA+ superfamily ATPase